MCKQNKLEGLIPVTRKNECWQPESSEVGYMIFKPYDMAHIIFELVHNKNSITVYLKPLQVYIEKIYW